ncbi:MAG: pitrilysin family protein [bacterium]
MKNKILIILPLLIFFIGCSSSRKIQFDEYNLDNGMHVILHEDHTTPIVAVSIMYHVGSKNEDAARTGFAHFFEHLMFEGSPNIGRGEYFKTVESAGGALNANTSFDRTFYYEILPSNQLELGLYLESERLLQLRIDSAGVETQRKVVKEERKQSYENRPYGSILEETFKRAYKVHPYQWMPIGSVQYIDDAKLDEFIDFHSIYYVPNNATLSIAGDITKDETKALIDKYFKEIPKGTKEIKRPTVIEPPMMAEIRDTIYDNIQLPAVIEAYRIPAQGTTDYYALNMLTTLLSSGQSSRLYKAVVDEQQKAVTAMSFPFSMEDSGLFLVFAVCNQGIEVTSVEDAMQDEIVKVQDQLIDEKEFQKLQNKIENDFVNENSRVAGISENLANYHVYFGDANLINTEIDRFMKVTREDIQRVAKQYLVKTNRVVLHYLPKSLKK